MSFPLEFRGLSLSKGSFSLQNIFLQVEKREIFALLGRTGAGKTLLLECAAGFYDLPAGTVLLNGRDMRTLAPAARRTGFVYQDYALFPHMSAGDNIAYGPRMRGAGKAEQKRLVREMAALLGLEQVLGQYPQTLSGGEKQRCALARALVLRPALLLLDEPFAALDPATRENLYAEIRRIPEAFDCAVLFVTHNFHEARLLARRAGIMIQGRLAAIRPVNQLIPDGGDEEADDFLRNAQGFE